MRPISVLALLLAASPLSAQTFTPVASPDIAAHVSFSLGVSWADYDGDTDLDLFVVTGFAANNANVLYRNDGGAFSRITGVAVTQDAAESACSTWSDYDNDGDLDAFVSNLVNAGGMLYEGHAGTDLTLNVAAGIGGAGLKGTGTAWGDYDNDGYTDLVIAALYGQGGITTGNRLFHNNGNGTFTEVTTGPQVTTLDSHHHPTWSDYDLDGDIDLFFGTGGPGFTKLDRLYKNLLKESGTATFQAITTGPIATDVRDSQVLQWIDVDNDLDLDMFAVNYSSVPNQLYRNDGGTFAKITTGSLVTNFGANHGAVWGDFDNDGDQDVYVARDNSQSNRYYRNEGGVSFTSITTGAFVNEGRSNYGAAGGDYDRDGDLDLFVPTARSEAASVLFRNDTGNGNHWLTVQCQGTLSNRSGIGAKVRVKAVIGGTPRWQMREIAAGTSYGGHNALEAHFGLGGAATVDSAIVEWPSGFVTRLTNVAADRLLSIVENSATPVFGAVAQRVVTPEGARIDWELPGHEGRSAAVERAETPGAWFERASVAVSPRGLIEFLDDSIEPGGRYGYRLRLDGPVGSQTLGETWIDVPLRPTFGIARVWPNPARGAVRFELELAASLQGTARLELFDVAGRRAFVRAIESPEAGPNVVVLESADLPGPGVYFARITQGEETDTRRSVIAE